MSRRIGPGLALSLLLAGPAAIGAQDQPCAEACKSLGQCHHQNGIPMCAALSDADCRGSGVCGESGGCHALGGVCVPASDADCKASKACKTYGRCFYFGEGNAGNPNGCVKDKLRTSADNGEKECKALSGAWVKRGKGRPRCALPTRDAGKLCASSEDCEAGCKAGKCARSTYEKGCGWLIKEKDGKIKTVCVD